MNELSKLLKQIHTSQFSGLPVDNQLLAFEKITNIATVDDVPALLQALDSARANFSTREMLAEPLCWLGGPSILEPLLVAFDRSIAEGHDNDSFQGHLWGLVESEPEESARVLREIRGTDGVSGDTIDWLLEFCRPSTEIDSPAEIKRHGLRGFLERIKGSR